MASGVTARFVLRSAAIRNAVKRAAPEAKAAGSPFSASSKTPLTGRIFRCPSEMSVCMGSMLPYHTATASSLMTSMLSVSRSSWLPGGLLGEFYRSYHETRGRARNSGGARKPAVPKSWLRRCLGGVEQWSEIYNRAQGAS